MYTFWVHLCWDALLALICLWLGLPRWEHHLKLWVISRVPKAAFEEMSILSVSCVASLLCCWLTLLSISYVMHEELYTLYMYVHISIEISRFGVFYATPHSGGYPVHIYCVCGHFTWMCHLWVQDQVILQHVYFHHLTAVDYEIYSYMPKVKELCNPSENHVTIGKKPYRLMSCEIFWWCARFLLFTTSSGPAVL